MRQICIRELRQHASVWLREVQTGEGFEITDRGRPVALLSPLPKVGNYARMVAAGEIRPAEGDLLDLGPPLPATPGLPTLSEILAEMRADQRF